MTKSKIFLFLSLSFIGGIFLASMYQKIIPDYYFLLVIVLILIFFIVSYPKASPAPTPKVYSKNILVLGFIGLFFIFGWWLTGAKLDKLNHLELIGKNFSEKVLVAKEPAVSGKMQKLILKSNGEERILINVPLYPQYAYGDELKLSCVLELPENFDPNFDYRMYLAKENIFYTCQKPQIELVQKNQGNKIYAGLIAVKNKLENQVEQIIPTPEAGLLIGLIIGGDAKLPKAMQDNFSQTGMTHIVAVSGYNVTIVAEYLIFLALALGLWRQQAFWFAVIGIILFVAMVGLPASAVRAGVMGVLLIWAMKNGRLANSQNAIVFAAAVMLAINPLLLRWDVGFQLSFLATLGIVYLYPISEKYLIGKNKMFGITEMLYLTLSAQIFVLPVILINFGKFSLISPLANILVLPIIPITMLLGFIAVMLKMIVPPLAVVFSWLVFLPLKYEVEIINFLAGLKWSSVEIKNFAWYLAAAWYIILIRTIFILRKNKSKVQP